MKRTSESNSLKVWMEETVACDSFSGTAVCYIMSFPHSRYHFPRRSDHLNKSNNDIVQPTSAIPSTNRLNTCLAQILNVAWTIKGGIIHCRRENSLQRWRTSAFRMRRLCRCGMMDWRLCRGKSFLCRLWWGGFGPLRNSMRSVGTTPVLSSSPESPLYLWCILKRVLMAVNTTDSFVNSLLYPSKK